MKTRLPSLVSLFTLFVTFSAFAQNSNKIKLADRLGDDFVKGKQHVALSIGIYNKGEISYHNYGTTIAGSNKKPTSETVYEIGSITKTFVSLILAKALVEKRIGLQDDIRKYLDGSFPNLEFDGQPVKVAHLANTTSGIPNWLPTTPSEITDAPADSTAFLRNRIYGKYAKADFFESLHAVKLDTVPGFKTRHSNAAAQLLTYILENVYESSIEKLVSDYITVPNKMANTSFLASKHKVANLVSGYDGKGHKMPHFTSDILKGAGGLNATTSDLVRFMKLQLDQRDKAIELSQAESFNAGQYSIGLNWLIYKHENGVRQIWTDGGTYGFVAYLVLYPEIDSGIVILTNTSDDETQGKIANIAYKLFESLQKK